MWLRDLAWGLPFLCEKSELTAKRGIVFSEIRVEHTHTHTHTHTHMHGTRLSHPIGQTTTPTPQTNALMSADFFKVQFPTSADISFNVMLLSVLPDCVPAITVYILGLHRTE